MTTDVDTLAQRAREALAHSGGGTLHIHGLGDAGHDAADLLLYDEDGRPTFLCDPDSPVVDAACSARSAILVVTPSAADLDEMTSVVFAGRLAVVGTEEVDGANVFVVGLQVCTVVVEFDDPASPTVVQSTVPVDRYRCSAPDPVELTIRRIVRHTNDAHAPDLRTFVACLRGVPVGDIAAAELAALDLHGVDVRWLDHRGAHGARIVFPEPATCAATLAARLRETLTGR